MQPDLPSPQQKERLSRLAGTTCQTLKCW